MSVKRSVQTIGTAIVGGKNHGSSKDEVSASATSDGAAPTALTSSEIVDF